MPHECQTTHRSCSAKTAKAPTASPESNGMAVSCGAAAFDDFEATLTLCMTWESRAGSLISLIWIEEREQNHIQSLSALRAAASAAGVGIAVGVTGTRLVVSKVQIEKKETALNLQP